MRLKEIYEQIKGKRIRLSSWEDHTWFKAYELGEEWIVGESEVGDMLISVHVFDDELIEEISE